MMEKSVLYLKNEVGKDERLARIVLSPRDIDPITNYPKESFITLRNQEGGISFLRFDYLGEDLFRSKGKERATFFNRNLKKSKYTFAGWMEGKVNEIISLSPNVITIEIDDPENQPEHVNIGFKYQGEVVKGIVTNAVILDILDELFHILKYQPA